MVHRHIKILPVGTQLLRKNQIQWLYFCLRPVKAKPLQARSPINPRGKPTGDVRLDIGNGGHIGQPVQRHFADSQIARKVQRAARVNIEPQFTIGICFEVGEIGK